MSGYALSKIRFRGATLVLLLALATMMVPFEAILIPLFLLFRKWNMINTYWPFWLPAVCYPFGTFLSKQFMDTLPGSLREAAMIDGAGEYQIFVRIYLPLCQTLAATLAVLQFLASWNNLLWPLIVLNDSTKYTIQIVLSMFKSILGDWGNIIPWPAVLMAGTVMSVVPVLVVFLLLQRYIVRTIAFSGLKQ